MAAAGPQVEGSDAIGKAMPSLEAALAANALSVNCKGFEGTKGAKL